MYRANPTGFYPPSLETGGADWAGAPGLSFGLGVNWRVMTALSVAVAHALRRALAGSLALPPPTATFVGLGVDRLPPRVELGVTRRAVRCVKNLDRWK